jgi:uncharacterized protein YqjF (DUF2071 family)
VPSPFLTAAWRDLLLLNWRVDSVLLAPHVPAGTELDSWDGAHWVSLVGFRFLDLAVKGVPVLGHRDFPEINLRFYVRREVDGEFRRGVVFLRELTPRRMVEWVARAVYNEPYQTLPMRSGVSETQTQYELQQDEEWQGMAARPTADWRAPEPMEEFFIEHYWGYNRQTDGGAMEYEVTHPKWRTRPVELARFDLGVETLYGPEWGSVLARKPDSVVLADGSEVAVFSGERI